MTDKAPTSEALKSELRDQKDVFVLYLDDEEDLLEPVGVLVEELGFKPFVTTDPAQALQFILENRRDLALIFSDLKMPGMDGFSFRQKVSELAPEIPFAVLSGFVDTELALRGVELKICAFVPKPFDEIKLTELCVRETLGRVKNIKEDRELRSGFIAESEDLIVNGESLLLAIDENPQDRESIDQFFGIIHTLKGASSFFEPKTFHRIAHRYEDLLKKIQRSEVEYSQEFSSVLFRGFDLLKELFSEFREGVYSKRDVEALLSSISINMDRPASDGPAKAATELNTNSPPAGAGPAKSAHHSNEDVKVSIVLLDEFMQLSGEVTVIRNMLNKCVRSIERQYSGDRDVAMVVELLDELHKINGGVQNKISEIRKVPVKSVIKAIPRAVRDISKQIGKQIELEVLGEELRVDTAVAEVLGNSLLHIVKNSMDHGLEAPEKRRQNGKPEKGRVTLRFQFKDDKVIVEIEDDGQGINGEAIKAKLIKNGTHTPEQVDKMSNAELYAMIFASGFSTAAQVTDISGRGVGMSMVKSSVDALGGEILIDSNPGVGTKFRLILPAPKSVLIASCLSVRAGTLQLGLMQDDILRVLQFDKVQSESVILDLPGASTLLYEGELLPIARLRSLIQVDSGEQAPRSTDVRRLVIMHSAQDGRRIAVEVDEVLDVEDTVIKGIHPSLNSKSIYRGITFLDDGTLGLILSTHGLLDLMNLTQRNPEKNPIKSKTDRLEQVKCSESPNNIALLVRLSPHGIYALRLEDIHRIEEVRLSDVKQSGDASVIPYRGGVLQVRDLGRLFEENSVQESREIDGVFPLIVVRRGGGFLGLKVFSVMDTVNFDKIQNELSDLSRAIEGHFFYQEKTVTLLSLENIIVLLDKVRGRSRHESTECSSEQAA